VFVGGKLPALDGVEVVADGPFHLAADVAEALRERRGTLRESDNFVDGQHLPVAVRSRADADGRDVDCFGHRGAEVSRDVFEDERERARVLVLARQIQYLLRGLLVRPLPEEAGLVLVLGVSPRWAWTGMPSCVSRRVRSTV